MTRSESTEERDRVARNTPCVWCGSPGPLRKSHIISEFAYKPLYDGVHRLQAVDASNPSDISYEQKGWRARLLCDNCESRRNTELEMPFLEGWKERNPRKLIGEQRGVLVEGYVYETFKLFHLSVLHLAHSARHRHPSFRDVDLGPHEETIRRMLLRGEPGDDWVYPIVCSIPEVAPGKLMADMVGHVHRGRMHGHRCYCMTFLGCQWLYFITTERIGELEGIRFRREGLLPVARLPLVTLEIVKANANTRL